MGLNKEELIKKTDNFVRENPLKTAAAGAAVFALIAFAVVSFSGSASGVDGEYSDDVVLSNFEGVSEEDLENVDGWEDLEDKAENNESEINISSDDVEDLKQNLSSGSETTNAGNSESGNEDDSTGSDGDNTNTDEEGSESETGNEDDSSNDGDGVFPDPGEYPNTDGGESDSDQGFIGNLLGNEQAKIDIKSVKYGYTGEDKPFIDLSVNVSGLGKRNDLNLSTDVKDAKIIDPSGNEFDDLGKGEAETYYGGEVQTGSLLPSKAEADGVNVFNETGWDFARAYYEYDSYQKKLQSGNYELVVDLKGTEEPKKADFYIPEYRRVKFPVIKKELNSKVSSIETSYRDTKTRARHNVEIVLGHPDGVSRFNPNKSKLVIENPEGETFDYSEFAPQEKKEVSPYDYQYVDKEYNIGSGDKSTLKLVIPPSDYVSGNYEVRFESELRNITYGGFNFDLPERNIEISNPRVLFKDRVESGGLNFDTPLIQSLAFDASNTGQAAKFITNFEYKGSNMEIYESWNYEGNYLGDMPETSPKKIVPGAQSKTMQLRVGQSDYSWDNYNGSMTFRITTGDGENIKVSGELEAPKYSCETGVAVTTCVLQKQAEYKDTEITRGG